MSRFIDYDAIDYKNYNMIGMSQEFMKGVVYMAERIDEAPSIEIIRCRECKYWTNGDDTYGICYRCANTRQMKADDFCSYGEREGE